MILITQANCKKKLANPNDRAHYLAMPKNPYAQELGRMKKGTVERPSARKTASSRVNIAKAIAARSAKHAAKQSASAV